MKKKSLHGNLMVIHQLGVFINGEPNIGKSELTLALLDRGHQLVSDDVVDIRSDQQRLIGQCPLLIQNFLLIHGIGMINIPRRYGEHAIERQCRVQLMLTLMQPHKMPISDNPLQPIQQEKTILNIPVPEIIFPAVSGKNLPLLIDTLVYN